MTNEKTRVILCAEDEPAHATIVRKAVQRNVVGNVQLSKVGNGRAALDYLYSRGPYEDSTIFPRPDLILLDLRVLHVCGLEVLAMVKNDPELQTIPVVVLTTSDVEEDRSQERLRCEMGQY